MDMDPGLFRAALDTMLDCVSILTSVRDASGLIVDFRIEYQNAAACANNRVAPEQIGRLLCEVLPAHRETGLFEDYVRVVETGAPLTRRVVQYTDDYRGQRAERFFDVRASKLGDGFLTAFRDVTLDEELRRARELASSLMNNTPAAIFVKDREGRYLMANPRVTMLVGASVVGKTDYDILPRENADALRANDLEALRAEEPIQREEVVQTPLGRRTYLTSKFALHDVEGKPHAVCGVAVDITDRKGADERFAKAFNTAPLGIVISRLEDGLVIDVNRAMLELIERTRDDVVGKVSGGPTGFIVSDRAPLAEALRRDGHFHDLDMRMRTRSGREVIALVSAEVIELGGVKCALSMVRDVTEQRRTLEALRKSEAAARARAEELATVLDATPAAIWIARDPECKEVSGSRAAYELLRMSEGANLSKTGPDADLVGHFRVLRGGAETDPQSLPLQRAARDGHELRDYEEEILFADGSRRWLYGAAKPLPGEDGKPRGAIAAFVDVTRLKQAENALREADQRKDEFLAMLSHELRNPLAPIRNAVQLLLRGEPDRKLLDVIDRQTAHLHRLVDDLLDVARVTQGKIVLQRDRLELLNVVGQALETSRPLIEAKRHQLTVSLPEQPLQIDGDGARLAQVIANLLNNAAKYTEPGGQLALRAARHEDEVRISVADDGMGIAPGDLPQVFDLFVQSQRSIDRAQGGLGVGLTLVRKLVEMHGGSVSAKSGGPGQGSEFTLSLPLARPPVAGPRSLDHHPRHGVGPGRRVLVVDDNVDSAETVAMLLEIDGHVTRLAHDGPAALALAREFVPELVLLDLGLPGMSGYEVAQRMRQEPALSGVKLIAVTGYGREDDRRRSRDAGFEHHLTKPVEYEELGALVRGG
jgi:PAS domain S-box-containing protein